jgi:hypothetical protein
MPPAKITSKSGRSLATSLFQCSVRPSSLAVNMEFRCVDMVAVALGFTNVKRVIFTSRLQLLECSPELLVEQTAMIDAAKLGQLLLGNLLAILE